MTKLLRPDLVVKLEQLADHPFPPPVIRQLRTWVDGETRALAVRKYVLGPADKEGLVRTAVLAEVKLRLDALYIKWAEQELSLEQACQQPTT